MDLLQQRAAEVVLSRSYDSNHLGSRIAHVGHRVYRVRPIHGGVHRWDVIEVDPVAHSWIRDVGLAYTLNEARTVIATHAWEL